MAIRRQTGKHTSKRGTHKLRKSRVQATAERRLKHAAPGVITYVGKFKFVKMSDGTVVMA